MNVWSRMLTALRGGATDAGIAVTDGEALRILDQEIRDSDAELHRSRQALAGIMARHRLATEQVAASKAKVDEYEGYALKALEAGDDALALEVAGRIALHESTCEADTQQVALLAAGVARLRKAIGQAEGHIRRLKQQVDTVKATESVQRAQAAVAHRHAGSHSRVQTALESLDRIKQTQAERGARMDAAEELAAEEGPDALDAKLRRAGIIPDSAGAQAVLARLKVQSAS